MLARIILLVLNSPFKFIACDWRKAVKCGTLFPDPSEAVMCTIYVELYSASPRNTSGISLQLPLAYILHIHEIPKETPVHSLVLQAGMVSTSRERPIQSHRSGDESSGELYESSGAGRNTAQRLGRYGTGMDPCAKIGRPAHGSMSQSGWIEM